ncbi:tyrosine-type recombinase/integrase [Shimia thalassica]|uniref:tyrosine-type recombinase/integrase n=1 Tax=Shimia thalassica TaxID=1715693 RepID=UPI0026E2289E|nr:site-specific integrase [Shimia thalassica]MDO6483535.1 site-specific integrase [Shimia thalassica]
MSRPYSTASVNTNMVLSVKHVQTTFGVCSNTVSNWRKNGLLSSDDSLPLVFRGAELIRFHRERRHSNVGKLRLGQFSCFGCQAAVFPEIASVSIGTQGKGAPIASAMCCDCGGAVSKRLGATECDKIKTCIDHNTSLAGIDEWKVEPSACVGKETPPQKRFWFTINDRIIFEWQIYAGRYNPKTVLAHLVSIRDFEVFLEGLPFDKMTTKRAAAYRDHLVRLAISPKDQGGLSNSTVRHRAAHLSLFFKWLRGQKGYRCLSASLPDYFALPRGATAKNSRKEPKAYLTIEDAWRMVEAMPCASLAERRDRAMIAFCYVSGLRVGAPTSVRLKHLDLEKKAVLQDANEMAAKNGKTYRAKWFPRTDLFQGVFLDWVKDLKALGFQSQDGVFPAIQDLRHHAIRTGCIEPLESGRPLQTAFCRASEAIDQRCTPHSARHTLKALGARICRTQGERKAWSMNLGHDDDQITERHYGKMSQTESDAHIDAMCSDDLFTDDDNNMIIDFHEGRFRRGTSEYKVARRLAEKRENPVGTTK